MRAFLTGTLNFVLAVGIAMVVGHVAGLVTMLLTIRRSLVLHTAGVALAFLAVIYGAGMILQIVFIKDLALLDKLLSVSLWAYPTHAAVKGAVRGTLVRKVLAAADAESPEPRMTPLGPNHRL